MGFKKYMGGNMLYNKNGGVNGGCYVLVIHPGKRYIGILEDGQWTEL